MLQFDQSLKFFTEGDERFRADFRSQESGGDFVFRDDVTAHDDALRPLDDHFFMRLDQGLSDGVLHHDISPGLDGGILDELNENIAAGPDRSFLVTLDAAGNIDVAIGYDRCPFNQTLDV